MPEPGEISSETDDLNPLRELFQEKDIDLTTAGLMARLCLDVIRGSHSRPTVVSAGALMAGYYACLWHLLWLMDMGEDPEPARQRMLVMMDDLYLRLKRESLLAVSGVRD